MYTGGKHKFCQINQKLAIPPVSVEGKDKTPIKNFAAIQGELLQKFMLLSLLGYKEK